MPNNKVKRMIQVLDRHVLLYIFFRMFILVHKRALKTSSTKLCYIYILSEKHETYTLINSYLHISFLVFYGISFRLFPVCPWPFPHCFFLRSVASGPYRAAPYWFYPLFSFEPPFLSPLFRYLETKSERKLTRNTQKATQLDNTQKATQ